MGEDRRDELYSDIDRYMAQRRRMEPTKKVEGQLSDLEVYHEESPQKGLWRRFMEWLRPPKPEVEAFEPEPQLEEQEPVPRKGLLKRLMGLFIKEEEIVEELPEEQPVVDAKADLKDLAQLFLKTLERLPEDELREFKKTEEFMRFKEILRRHEVIR